MIENRSLTEAMLELLSTMVKGRLNLLISGGTGAGKTTLLNVLSGYIPNAERIVTIEDAAELQMKQEHVVRLETRPPNIEGKGAVRQRQLVINTFVCVPDRIVVGEVRGEEAFDMLQAMNTGHEGSLTTVHADSVRDALARIENMVSMANLNIPERAVRHQIASAIHAVVQVARMSGGTRKIISISEVTGMEGDMITMQDIFVFERKGIDETGKVRGLSSHRHSSAICPAPGHLRCAFARSAVRIENRGTKFCGLSKFSAGRCKVSKVTSHAGTYSTSGFRRGCARHLCDRDLNGPAQRPGAPAQRPAGHRAQRSPPELEEEFALLRDEQLSTIPALDTLLRRSERATAMQHSLLQAGMKLRAGNFLIVCIACGLVAAFAAFAASKNPAIAWAAMVLGAFLPYAFVSYRRQKRFEKIEELFPEAIDTLAAPSRAGHAFTTALEMISNEVPEPLAGEFRQLFEEQKFGMPVRDALMNLTDRVPLMDVKFFVTAVMLQRETGGNIAEILGNLSNVIRERFKIQRQVRVYTAQGRLTMVLLMTMPPAVVAILSVFAPDFVRPLFHDPIGHTLLVASLLLQTTGYFVIRRIIRIQV